MIIEVKIITNNIKKIKIKKQTTNNTEAKDTILFLPIMENFYALAYKENNGVIIFICIFASQGCIFSVV
jgi:hypothetical protein